MEGIDLPEHCAPIRQLSAPELKALLASGTTSELVVRIHEKEGRVQWPAALLHAQ